MTQGEKVDELAKLTAVLEERLRNVQSQLNEVVSNVSEIDKSLRTSAEKFAICESQVRELRQDVKESASKRAAFWTSFLTALAVAVLAFFGQLYLASMKK